MNEANIKYKFFGKIIQKVYTLEAFMEDYNTCGFGYVNIPMKLLEEIVCNEIIKEYKIIYETDKFDFLDNIQINKNIIINGENLVIEKIVTNVNNNYIEIKTNKVIEIIEDIDSYRKARAQEVDYWKERNYKNLEKILELKNKLKMSEFESKEFSENKRWYEFWK